MASDSPPLSDDEIRELFGHVMTNKYSLPVAMDWMTLMRLCDRAIEILREEPVILTDVTDPLIIVGDIHGQFHDLMTYITYLEQSDESVKALFLGDYVDRGENSLEVITVLLCLRILYPSRIILLRGNHETRDISGEYGFYGEAVVRYGDNDGDALWEKFNDVFDYLSLAAIVSNKIFCVHGGLAPDMGNPEDLNERFTKPLTIGAEGIPTDLLWSDPVPEDGWNQSPRGISGVFGQDVLEAFCTSHVPPFELVCRAHQVAQDGFNFPYEDNPKIVTIFSARNYQDMGNKAAVLQVYTEGDTGELRCECKDHDEIVAEL